MRDHSHVLLRSRWDQAAFDAAADVHPDLRRLADRSRWHEVVLEDLHAALHKRNPRVDPESEADSHQVALLSEAVELPEYERLTATTRGDELAAALGTVELGKLVFADPPTSDDPDEVRRYARRVLGVVEEAVEGAKSDLALLGGGTGRGYGENDKTDAKAIIEASRRARADRKLRSILKLAGRMELARGRIRSTRVAKGPGAVVGVEAGDDLARVLPAELALMDLPGGEEEFTRRLVERQLLQLETTADEHTQRGPIVVCLDSSASMAGNREVWAKAVALALLQGAMEDDRAFALVTFSGCSSMPCDPRGKCSRPAIKTWEWPTRPSPTDLLDALAFNWNGGTCFQSPLEDALKECEKSKFDRADVVFITDGDARLNPGWLSGWRERKEVRGVRLWTILIQSHSKILDVISDGVEHVDQLDRDEGALRLAFSA